MDDQLETGKKTSKVDEEFVAPRNANEFEVEYQDEQEYIQTLPLSDESKIKMTKYYESSFPLMNEVYIQLSPEQIESFASKAVDNFIDLGRTDLAWKVVYDLPSDIQSTIENRYHLLLYDDLLGFPSKEIYNGFITAFAQGDEALNSYVESIKNHNFSIDIPMTERGEVLEDNEGQFDEKIYIYGVPISQEKQSIYDNDALKGEIVRKDPEYFRSLIDPEKVLTSEEKEEIVKRALPLFNTTNLVFHHTNLFRIPIVSKTGLLPRIITDRYIESRYKGVTSLSSGWGTPFIGQDVIDVWDPSYQAGFGEDNYKLLSGGKFIAHGDKKGRISHTEPIDGTQPIRYETIEDDKLEKAVQGGAIATRVLSRDASFIIKMSPGRESNILRRTPEGDKGRKNWSYVKGKVRPEELAGLVIRTNFAQSKNKLVYLVELFIANQSNKKLNGTFVPEHLKIDDGEKRWRPTLSFKAALEIIGANIHMPIYDTKGDLIWPQQMSHEQVKQFVAERDKNKEQNKETDKEQEKQEE